MGKFILTLLLLATGVASAQPISRLSTSFLVRGEQATLEVAVSDGTPIGQPEITQVKDIRIQETNLGPLTQMIPGRNLEYVYQYRVTGYEVGKHTIPPIRVNVDGQITMTEPIEFIIFNPDELQPTEVTVGDRLVRCYSTFRVLNSKPFENETTPAEIKIFVPRDLNVQDWGIPDFQRDGLAAWRFQPSRQTGAVNILGVPYYSIAYPSTITPTRTGPISIGPAKVRLVTQENVMNPFSRWVNVEMYVEVPKLEMESQPLPAGAPAGFDNAVGSFELSARTDTAEIQEGDPITVDLTLTGSGNLDTLRPPQLSDTDGWKVYTTTTDQRGDERRELSGRVDFHQSIRPLEMKSEIPPFRFVYFDPKAREYKTLVTQPIALSMTPNTSISPEAAAQTLPVPFERMNDILALIPSPALTTATAPAIQPWIGHGIAALLALVLILKALWMRLAPGLHKNPDEVARTRALQAVSQSKSSGDSEFLRAAGSFIERHLGNHPSAEIRQILAERDAVCFRNDKPTSSLDRKRRDEILRVLRNSALAIAAMLVFGNASTARAEDISAQATAAYDSAKYEDAIKLWLSAGNYDELSADTLYNIGNACYRAASPGYAALYYRRALTRDSSHQEARQNLRFIERKYGAITIQRPDYQYAVAKFPITSWQNMLWSGLWLCGLALLVFPATRPGARLRWAAIAALVVGPLLVSGGLLGWRYFPNDAQFAPVTRQAVIVQEKVALHTDAARTAPEVIDAPPGSLCEVIRESGSWVYIAFASKTRGWVLRETLEMVQPATPPAPPKFRKPKGDGKSA
ncbi:MAG: BatD family protein [Verrucomicrobiota bacterium]